MSFFHSPGLSLRESSPQTHNPAFDLTEENPFDKAQLTRVYESHNTAVEEYFRHRPGALLTINLREQNAAQKVMEFLGLPYGGETMPHLNRST